MCWLFLSVMAASMASLREQLIREAILESVVAYHHQHG